VPSSDTVEVSEKKSEKDAPTDPHSSDLFSVHNFDVTIDLNFPSGQCYSFAVLLYHITALK